MCLVPLGAGSNWSSGTHATTWSAYSQGDVLVDNQVNLADSTSNEWYITGVQLEVGSVATEFEHRSFGEELALCQRYYEVQGGTTSTQYAHLWTGDVTSGNSYYQTIQFSVVKRATPTITMSSASQSKFAAPSATNTSTIATSGLAVSNATGARGFFYVGVLADAEL